MNSNGLHLADQRFPRLVLLAAAALAIYEAEEWDILRWYREHWNNVGDLSNRTVWTWLVFYSLLAAASDDVPNAPRSSGLRSERVPTLDARPFGMLFGFP